MRVALVGPYPRDLSRIPGGIAAVTTYLVQGLRLHRDIDLHVISTTKELDRRELVQDGNVTIHHIPEPSRRLMPNLLTNIGRIEAEIREIKPDLVHSESAVGTAAGFRSGHPTMHTIHGILHKEIKFGRTFTQKLGTRVEARLAKKAVAGVRHCIATSNYAARAYAPYTSAKMHYIFNPIEDRFFELPNNEIPNKMLYAGVFSPRKDILGLVRAFDMVHRNDPRAELFICGKPTLQDYYAEVEQYVASANLGESVHLLGYVTQDDIGRHFSEAAMLCLFSLEETAPMVVAQAMCSGTPVVASNAGGTPDLVLDGETGFVVQMGDDKAFAERALRLLGDAELRRRMGARAREVAEERFRIGAVAAQTVEVYRELLSEQQSGRK